MTVFQKTTVRKTNQISFWFLKKCQQLCVTLHHCMTWFLGWNLWKTKMVQWLCFSSKLDKLILYFLIISFGWYVAVAAKYKNCGKIQEKWLALGLVSVFHSGRLQLTGSVGLCYGFSKLDDSNILHSPLFRLKPPNFVGWRCCCLPTTYRTPQAYAGKSKEA